MTLLSRIIRNLYVKFNSRNLDKSSYTTGGDYNTDISGLSNTFILTALTPKTSNFDIGGMTAITPETLKIGLQNDPYKTKDIKNQENDQMTAITPLAQKIAKCYSHPNVSLGDIFFMSFFFHPYLKNIKII